MQLIVNGTRIRLRPYRDYAEYEAWELLTAREGDPYWGPYPEPGIRDRREFAGSGLLSDEYGCFAVEQLATGRHIGNEYYSSHDGFMWSAVIGTRIHPELRGQGYGVEAKRLVIGWLFGNYPIRHVCAETMDDHHVARRGLELCGMQLYGIKPCEEFSRGEWHGAVYYGISREQWQRGAGI
ncbi:MAG: GNAT family protein [bacterium]